MQLERFLGGLVAALTLSCGSPTHPGELQPLAPRPGPVEPQQGGETAPVPGAPDPMARTPDAAPLTLREAPMPAYGASAELSGEFGAAPSDEGAIPMQKVKAKPDAAIGGGDAAAPLPPVPDALPTDASRTTR